MYDIAVIGAGPAGATLARLLGRDRKVALIEKRDPDAPASAASEKCCGGLLAPDAQRELARQGIGVPRCVLSTPQLFAVRSLDLVTGRGRLYQRHYMNIDRFRFDRWLASLVSNRVTVFAPALATGVTAGRRGFIIRYRKGGREYSIEAGLVLGATGAGHPVSGLPAPAAGRLRRYIAIEGWYGSPAGEPWYQALFDPAITDYYAWTIPKDGEVILGAALDPAADPPGRFAALERSLAERGLVAGTPRKKRSAFLFRPTLPGALLAADYAADGMALAGEAAGFISPSSGEGLSYALESAALLAGSVLSHGRDFARQYIRATTRLRRRIALKCLKTPFLYQPRLRAAIMAAGWRSIGRADPGDRGGRPVPATGWSDAPAHEESRP